MEDSERSRQRFGLVVIVFALAVIAALLLFGHVGATGGVPYNGNFDYGGDGWRVNNTTFHCGVNYVAGYTSVPAGETDDECILQSAGFTASNGSSVDVDFMARNSSGGSVVLKVLNNSGGELLSYTIGISSTWSSVNFQTLMVGSGSVSLGFVSADSGTVQIDDVSVTGGTTGYATPTAVSPATATPRPVLTPDATPAAGATAAIARLTIGAETVVYTTQLTPQPLVLDWTAPAADNSHLAYMGIKARDVGFCLPEEIAKVFTGIPSCFTIPFWEFSGLWILGINVMPYLSVIGTAVFIVFLIIRVREK